MNMKVKCPTCKKELFWSDKEEHRPFCCERCKLIDLGEWASENHRIPTEHDMDGTSPVEDDNYSKDYLS